MHKAGPNRVFVRKKVKKKMMFFLSDLLDMPPDICQKYLECISIIPGLYLDLDMPYLDPDTYP